MAKKALPLSTLMDEAGIFSNRLIAHSVAHTRQVTTAEAMQAILVLEAWSVQHYRNDCRHAGADESSFMRVIVSTIRELRKSIQHEVDGERLRSIGRTVESRLRQPRRKTRKDRNNGL